MKMNALILTATAFVVPGFAQAQTFSLPNGCTAFVTVQSKDCSVSHHFICEGDAPGEQRRADLNEETMTYVGRIDSETQWIESFHLLAGTTERLVPNPANPASFTDLLSSGEDTWDFMTENGAGLRTRYVGFDRLTGEEEVIDGVTLKRTYYEITAMTPDGQELWRASGNEYISPEWRMFLSGQSHYITSDDDYQTDGAPVEFLYPGDPGFLSVHPKFGCGVVMSSLELD